MVNLLNMTTFQGYLFVDGTYTALEFYIYVWRYNTKRFVGFGLRSNSRGEDEIKGLQISIDFRNRNTVVTAIQYYISMTYVN